MKSLAALSLIIFLAVAGGVFLWTGPAAAHTRVLIDSSRGGGVWWSSQGSPFDPDQPHQGKAFADYLRWEGYELTELPSPTTIDLELLTQYQIVIRANEFDGYIDAELDAYRTYVSEGGRLLLLQDFLRPSGTDQLGPEFGLKFWGTTRGDMAIDFVAHTITDGVAVVTYEVGSGLRQFPTSAVILGHLAAGGYLDLTGIPQIKPTFLEIAPSGIPSNIIPHSKGVKCGLIRSNSPFSYSNHRPAKPKIPKPLVYAQVSPLGTSFATP